MLIENQQKPRREENILEVSAVHVWSDANNFLMLEIEDYWVNADPLYGDKAINKI